MNLCSCFLVLLLVQFVVTWKPFGISIRYCCSATCISMGSSPTQVRSTITTFYPFGSATRQGFWNLRRYTSWCRCTSDSVGASIWLHSLYGNPDNISCCKKWQTEKMFMSNFVVVFSYRNFFVSSRIITVCVFFVEFTLTIYDPNHCMCIFLSSIL